MGITTVRQAKISSAVFQSVNTPIWVTNSGSLGGTIYTGNSVSIQLSATDPQGRSLTYSCGTLPPGLSLSSSTGLITGTVSLIESSSYTFDAIVSNGINSSTRSFTIDITKSRLPIRYLRGISSGSTANTGNHWVEVQAINSSGTNVAAGVSSPSTILTNGNVSTGDYWSAGDGSDIIWTMDLGQLYYNISSIKFWMYYGDGRTYYNVGILGSADGSNFTYIRARQNNQNNADGTTQSVQWRS